MITIPAARRRYVKRRASYAAPKRASTALSTRLPTISVHFVPRTRTALSSAESSSGVNGREGAAASGAEATVGMLERARALLYELVPNLSGCATHSQTELSSIAVH